MAITSTDFVLEAQQRVDDALDVLTRLDLGDPRFDAALQEFEDAQNARTNCEERWYGRQR